HRRNVTGSTSLCPGFEALRRLFQIGKHGIVRKPLSKLRHHRLQLFPYSEELAASLEEKVFVEEAIVEQRASLFPVADYHSKEGSGLASGRRNAHGIIECFYYVILLEPVACLAEPGLATQVIDLKL